MIAFLRANGLSVRRYAEGEARVATLIDALDRGLPIIVSIPEHYLVIIGYSRSFLYMHDPSALSHPTNTVLRSDFRRRWTQEALIVTRTTSRTFRKATKKLTK